MTKALEKMEVIPGGGFKDPVYKKRWGFEHLAADYFAVYVPVFAPKDGELIGWQWGKEGGWWLLFRMDDGYLLRAAHHSKRIAALGRQKEGTILAVTGATGTHRDGTPNDPHWHCEIINPLGVHVDPEWYFNQSNTTPMRDYNNSIVRNPEDGSFYFFKKTKEYAMARQPLSANTVSFALLTLKQVWKDKDYEHIFQADEDNKPLTTAWFNQFAVVWSFFGGEDQSYIDAHKNG